VNRKKSGLEGREGKTLGVLCREELENARKTTFSLGGTFEKTVLPFTCGTPG